MTRYREQVAAALGAVTIRGPARYAWLGRPSRPLPASIDAELDASARRAYLVTSLREELYHSFYCHGRPVPARWGEPDPGFPDRALAEAMSAANCGRGSWDRWTVQRLDPDEAVVTSAGLRARVSIGDCRAEAGVISPGTAVRVRLPKELPALSPGFYTAVGDAVADRAVSSAIVRVYWNVTRTGAAALVRALTTGLNRAGMPFRLKVADHPLRFERCDAGVLYLEADAFSSTRPALRAIATTLGARLRPDIPAFTLQLAPGVGLAEDDGSGGESFGMRRCALLADGIVAAHERGETGPAARLDTVLARFAHAGVQARAPYREPSLAGRHVL